MKRPRSSRSSESYISSSCSRSGCLKSWLGGRRGEGAMDRWVYSPRGVGLPRRLTDGLDTERLCRFNSSSTSRYASSFSGRLVGGHWSGGNRVAGETVVGMSGGGLVASAMSVSPPRPLGAIPACAGCVCAVGESRSRSSRLQKRGPSSPCTYSCPSTHGMPSNSLRCPSNCLTPSMASSTFGHSDPTHTTIWLPLRMTKTNLGSSAATPCALAAMGCAQEDSGTGHRTNEGSFGPCGATLKTLARKSAVDVVVSSGMAGGAWGARDVDVPVEVELVPLTWGGGGVADAPLGCRSCSWGWGGEPLSALLLSRLPRRMSW
mmetsp:Transcript_26518/g.76027  ORF Transcript_26518/g.76027 Transcript_26518/m.76027 type:complete len:319 (-) Transcript_26518:564-1520(-)